MDVRLEALGFDHPGGPTALDGLDLHIRSGETVALIGANGSGKTTLLRHLDGLLRPTRGRVLVGGQDAAGLTVARLAARVGLAFADPDPQLFCASVRAEVEFGPRHLGRTRVQGERAVASALAATGLADVAETNPHDLGSARRRLVAVASVLSMGTPIVALDEPTAGLDALTRERVTTIVRELAAAGRTVVVASHDLRFVAETFGRVVMLRAGRVVVDGTPGEVFAEEGWGALGEAGLTPPEASVRGARLGLGSTPTEAALIAALRDHGRGPGSERQGGRDPAAT
jgi:energy-coupling factor transporter ATP-binding protein EcfA2